ncbi:ROK family protein [Micromonospora purpureochromogenes]|uniref:ROK family protein n=1 Tax=Micromonospora purpureochromogenes TaxID=47872 RepID=UPI0033EAC1D7
MAGKTDPSSLTDFAYLFLGEGLGCAVVSDGQVRRGHAGLAGEIAHLITIGPDGRASRFIEVFGDLGLRRPGSTAIDVDRLRQLADASSATREAIGAAVSGVLAAIVALTDPQLVVLGGPWGPAPRPCITRRGPRPAVLDAVTAAFGRLPRHVDLRAARLTPGNRP